MGARGSYKLGWILAGVGIGIFGWTIITSPGIRQWVATPTGTFLTLLAFVVIIALAIKK